MLSTDDSQSLSPSRPVPVEWRRGLTTDPVDRSLTSRFYQSEYTRSGVDPTTEYRPGVQWRDTGEKGVS